MATLRIKDENVDTTVSMLNIKKSSQQIKVERKTLQVLQHTPDNRLTRKSELLQSAKILKKPFAVFKDSSLPKVVPKKECTHTSTQTENEECYCSCHNTINVEESPEEEAYRLMGQGDVPEHYWKEIAETRRQALDDSLLENELLNTEVADLKKENRRLSELAENAAYFANILKKITPENKDDDISQTSDSIYNEDDDDDDKSRPSQDELCSNFYSSSENHPTSFSDNTVPRSCDKYSNNENVTKQ